MVCYSMTLILFFKKNITDAEKLLLRKHVKLWALRFTFLTIHINVFMCVSLVNYVLNKKYQVFARRLLNFAMTIFTAGVILYWVFISYELHNHFQTQFKYNEIRRFHEFIHVFMSHGFTWIIALAAYILARKDLVIIV